MSSVLLLTSSIVPKYNNNVARSDETSRVKDYQESILSWYKSQWFEKIVFCDNSGFSEDELKLILCKGSDQISNIIDNIEILTCEDEPDFRYHYGYSELGLIDFAILNSKALKISTHFTKCTGRLFYPNYNKLINSFPMEFKFCVDARENIFWIKNRQITSQLMVFNTSFYKKQLFNAKLEMSPEDYFIELFFYRKLILYKGDPYCYFRWPIELIPEGIAAHSNKNYSSFTKKVISIIRRIIRHIIPGLWI